eukprot:1160147-Pelagomonas_calceolata.AAC.5
MLRGPCGDPQEGHYTGTFTNTAAAPSPAVHAPTGVHGARGLQLQEVALRSAGLQLLVMRLWLLLES